MKKETAYIWYNAQTDEIKEFNHTVHLYLKIFIYEKHIVFLGTIK